MDGMTHCMDGISHILTKDKTGGLFDMEDEILKNKDDETDKFFETIEEREERLKAISTEVSQARGVEAKMEIMARQIDLLATSLQFATINIENLADEVNRLNKKNRKLKKRIDTIEEQNKDLYNMIQNISERVIDLEEKHKPVTISADE